MVLPLRGARLLIVGPSPARYAELVRWLERDGAEVTSVETHAAAIAALGRERYHAMIGDLALGREALAMVEDVRGHGRASSIVAIALAATSGSDDFVSAMAAGYQLYLGAPLDVLAAVDLIRHRLSMRAG